MITTSVKICNDQYTVNELKVRDISDLFGLPDDTAVTDRIRFLLEKSSSFDIKKIGDYAPSDLQPLMDAILEVNSSFFGQAGAVSMAPAADVLKNLINSVSMVAFAR